MTFSIRRITRAFNGRHSKVRLSAGLWQDLVRGLAERTLGVREAGAFLLACRDAGDIAVSRVVFFDDLDPECLTGNISLGAGVFGRLWDLCSADGLRVIADVHTHPGSFVAQSSIDQANPMVAVAGHIAIVVPHLAHGVVTPRACGVHIYLGNHRWQSAYDRQAARLVYVGRGA